MVSMLTQWPCGTLPPMIPLLTSVKKSCNENVRFPPSGKGDLSRFWLCCLGPLVFFAPENFKLFSFPIFRFWVYWLVVRFIPATRVHFIWYLRFYSFNTVRIIFYRETLMSKTVSVKKVTTILLKIFQLFSKPSTFYDAIIFVGESFKNLTVRMLHAYETIITYNRLISLLQNTSYSQTSGMFRQFNRFILYINCNGTQTSLSVHLK